MVQRKIQRIGNESCSMPHHAVYIPRRDKHAAYTPLTEEAGIYDGRYTYRNHWQAQGRATQFSPVIADA